MGRVAAIGESIRIQGLSLAGVLLLPGDTPDEAIERWQSLPNDVDIVILTAGAADAVRGLPGAWLTVVMPP